MDKDKINLIIKFVLFFSMIAFLIYIFTVKPDVIKSQSGCVNESTCFMRLYNQKDKFGVDLPMNNINCTEFMEQCVEWSKPNPFMEAGRQVEHLHMNCNVEYKNMCRCLIE